MIMGGERVSPMGSFKMSTIRKGDGMKAFCLVGLVMCLSAGLLFVASGQEPAESPNNKKDGNTWEYNCVNGEDMTSFNKLGAEGWELCATGTASNPPRATYIFKRLKGSKPTVPAERVASKFEGTWEHTFEDAPEHRQLKFINRTHFVWVTYNREDGKPLLVCGGTYTADGNTYKENCEFGGPGLPADLVGKEQVFTAEIDGDKWMHSGTLSNGFEVKEVWRKLK
jgi:hypothetical protein